MHLPDFLLIGAAKSGTTALFHYLSQHPQVYPCLVREPNFFALEGKDLEFSGPGDDATINKNSITNLADYEKLFEGVGLGQIAGEVSPLYLYDKGASERIHTYIPNAKLIVILRNPVDRAFASFLHLRRDDREPIKDFSTAIAAEQERVEAGWEHLWHYLAMGFYADQIERYYAFFKKDQIKVLLYNDFLDQPEKVIAACCSFLNLESGFEPDLSRRPNRSGIPRSRTLQNVMVSDGPIKQIVTKLLPTRARGRLVTMFQRWNLSKPNMDDSARFMLTRAFRSDMLALQELIDRDLSHWLEN